jgi:hypothetical protein
MPKPTEFPLFAGFFCSPRQFAMLERIAARLGQSKSEALRGCVEAQARRLGVHAEAGIDAALASRELAHDRP